MEKRTRVALVAGILGLAGVTGFAVASAGQGGWGGGPEMGMGHHGMGHGGRHGGMMMMHMLDELDTNKDKKLTQEEIDAARAALLTEGDADKNGQLSLDEYQTVWLKQMREMMVRQFQRLDRDGNAQVTAEEFNGPFADMVARMDRNDDKVLDASDRGRGGRHGMWRHRDRGGDDGMPSPGNDASPGADSEAPAAPADGDGAN